MSNSILKFGILFITIMSIMTSCSKVEDDGDNQYENIGISFVDYMSKDIPPVPDNVVELIAQSPCWVTEKVEYANVVDGNFYITDFSKSGWLGVDFIGSVCNFSKEGIGTWYYNVVIRYPSSNQPNIEFGANCRIFNNEISKVNILYYDGEEMIFTPYNLQNVEAGVTLFFTKVGSKELLDEWKEKIENLQN